MLATNKIYEELQNLKVHDYCCFIYETEEEWQESVIPFLIQGLKNGEKCIYVLEKRNESHIYQCFMAEGIDVVAVTSTGQLMVVDTNTIFAGNPVNDIDQIIHTYSTWLDIFLAEGYRAIRLSSEAHFGLYEYEPYGKFLELLMRLKSELFFRYPLLTICQYHRREDDAAILRDAIIASSWILKDGHMYHNPACISPETYFKNRHMGWEAEYWINTQEALMESEEKYRLMIEHSLDMIAILDVETYNILFVSPSSYGILGYKEEEVIGRNCIEFVHPDQQKQGVAHLQEGLRQGWAVGRYSLKKKDGSYLWMEGKGNVIRRAGNRDGYIIFGRDIHKQKLAEEALWQSQQEYKNQVNYLNTLINTMNELCITYDRNTVLTFVNQRMLEALGFRAEEMLGRSIMDFIPEENKESVRMQINNRLLNAEVSSHENKILRKDGSPLTVKLKGSPIVGNDEIIGGMVLAEDITQQRKIEKEMARLGQLNTVGEIAASIGHEIRNPMTTVQGFLQIMSQNEDFREYHAYFTLMLEEMGRANSIISEFLTLAKDKLANLECYNLNKIVDNLSPLLVADAIKEDKYIRFMLENVPELLLDEKEIRQLILNLVRNGLEANASGGIVTLKTYWEENQVVLSVSDQGQGIPSEILDKLGTPFLTTKEQGTGLGLAVCYSIAARHNADIEYDTSPKGSNFMVKFKLPGKPDSKQ